MKKSKGILKKILGTFAALAMAVGIVSASAVPVNAAGNGTITIDNPTPGNTYTVYKVFDATYSGANNENVAYTYSGNDHEFLTALRDSDLFEVNQIDSTTVSVIVKNSSSEENVISFFKQYGPQYDASTKKWTGGKYGTGTSITAYAGRRNIAFTNLDYGYYFVTTNTGSVVSIDNATPSAHVLDKNQAISVPDKEEQVQDDSNWKYHGTSEENPIPTASIGETVNYRVTGSFTQYVGETAVKNLVFTDTMSDGLTADQNVTIKINNTTLATYNRKANGETEFTKIGTGDVKYDVTYTKNSDNTWTTSIVIPTAVTDQNGNVTSFTYDPNNTYEITYSAKVNKDALLVDPEQNTVNLKYNDSQNVGSDTTKVAHYNLTLNKKDGHNTETTNDDSPLAGAKFQLYKSSDINEQNTITGAAMKVVVVRGVGLGDGSANSTATNTYRLAEDGETGSTVITDMVAGTDGKIVVLGLKNGDYRFIETEAPAGYNKLTTPTKVVTITNNNASIDVVNNAGPKLPSTGGMGTKLFYIAGGALIIVAAGLLISRKKKENA